VAYVLGRIHTPYSVKGEFRDSAVLLFVRCLGGMRIGMDYRFMSMDYPVILTKSVERYAVGCSGLPGF
jgi:hypothetical protein